MKRLRFLTAAGGLMLSFLLFAGARGVSGQTTADLSLIPADQALTRATAETNKAELDRLLDAKFTWINARGTRLSRANVLKAFPGVAIADVPPQMRFYSKVAIVTADHDQFHVLRVWVKRASGWRAVLYQEVQQVEKSEPAASSASAECENPCKTIPFQPQTQSEKEAISSWQGVMRAMAENNADAYAPLIADEFTATDTHHDRPYTKADRLAQIKKQKLSGARSTPPVLLSAQMLDFGDTVMMIAREQRPNAKAYFNTRMWVKRDGRWQMLFSFNTRIE
ncbi:MAG TPA: nuclear transport factor 2 family protein [Candidatus Angelobacter sp.]|nr:nuclear transport factor 2 family protein [Candidatus Angelobacter sp.]